MRLPFLGSIWRIFTCQCEVASCGRWAHRYRQLVYLAIRRRSTTGGMFALIIYLTCALCISFVSCAIGSWNQRSQYPTRETYREPELHHCHRSSSVASVNKRIWHQKIDSVDLPGSQWCGRRGTTTFSISNKICRSSFQLYPFIL